MNPLSNGGEPSCGQFEARGTLIALNEKVYIPAFLKRCVKLDLQLSNELDVASALKVAASLELRDDAKTADLARLVREVIREDAGFQFMRRRENRSRLNS
jgi:hypothetical protein